MKKLLGIVVLVLFITSQGQAKVKSKDINFANAFYEDSIQSCKAMGYNSFNSKSIRYKVQGLIGYDWHADWKANSTSISPIHSGITKPIKIFMAATHNAIGNNNQANIKIAKNLLLDLAKADTLYDSIGYYEVIKKPMCYAGGDINAPCWYHEYAYARDVFGNYMIAALWLRDELNEQEFKIVNQYIKKMYKKFLKPIEFHEEEQGFYQSANGGTSILVYASWTNNKKLAAEEINHRFQEMDRLFYEDGYINNNSFRGARARWYHSYGLNIALGYVYIADLWGAEVPEKLNNKLVKASKVANLAITNWDKFTSRKYSGTQHNKISSEDSANLHTHHMAFALDTLMKMITGVELEHDAVYLKKRTNHMRDGIDDLIGFNPNCIHKVIADNKEVVKEEAKRISADLELPIFDDLHYQLEGQTLKINIGDMVDPKMEPLKRHRDSLQKKCGSNLIDQSGWLSFISNETRDIQNDRVHHCYYNYFKESNDSQAFDLFKAVLSGANSIFDYLQTNDEP